MQEKRPARAGQKTVRFPVPTITAEQLFQILLLGVILLGGANLAQSYGLFIPFQEGPVVEDNVVWLNSMTTEQKVAQMIITVGHPHTMQAIKIMQLGGIHLYARQSERVFNNTIIDYQYGQPIPFFVTADFEGCVTPFGWVHESKAASEISTLGEAFEKGFRDGEFMKKLGFTMNFAPVVDLDDTIWNCRVFPGDETDIAEFAQAYILGLQDQGIIAVAKHYPGKTLVVQDPHKYIVSAHIEEKDVYPYTYLAERGKVNAVMVSHIITTGAVDSQNVPAVVSPEVIGALKKQFSGLIVSDEIHMLGLKNFFKNIDEMYIAVFAAGNDVILNFDNDPQELYRMIQVVSRAVDEGIISQKHIDDSVRKILQAKGFVVKGD